jgi:hypothetical protein
VTRCVHSANPRLLVLNRSTVVNGEQCCTIGRDAGAGSMQAGSSGPLSTPTPAFDATSAAETDPLSNCWTVDGELSCECLTKESRRLTASFGIWWTLTNSTPAADWTAVTEDELEEQALFAQRQALEVRNGVFYRQFKGLTARFNIIKPLYLEVCVLR